MGEDKCKLGFADGFKFGLGFFTAGLIFYLVILFITVIVAVGIFGATLHSL